MEKLKKGFLRTHALIMLYSLAAFIGIGAGLGALGFGLLIEIMNWIFLDLIKDRVLPSPWLFPVIPMAGIFVAMWITHRFAPEARGHGVPEVMAAAANHGGIIRPRVVGIKALVSALTIGTGGSVGREGPIVQIGSAIGSFVGQLLNFSGQRNKLMLACGAAAGISATFNAPIAGMMFSSEVILNDFSGVSMAPLIIASVMGTIVMRTVLGGSPASLAIGNVPFTLHWQELPLFIVLGVICGIGAWIFIKMLYGIEDLVDRIKLHWSVKSLCAGFLVGLIGLFYPRVLGIGYETIEHLFLHPIDEHGQLTLHLFFLVLLLYGIKVFSTSVTLAGGGSGGVFAPSLFLGAALGAAVGIASNIVFGTNVSSIGVFSICGMAAVVAGTTRAPITAILIVFEMTHNYQVILPLMMAVICAFAISSLLEKESIYTLKLARRGEAISRFGNVHSLASVSVKEVMTTDFKAFNLSNTVADLVDYIRDGKIINFPVLDENGDFYGFISTQKFRQVFFSQKPNREILLKEIAITDIAVLFPESSLLDAVERFSFRDVSAIPVVDVNNKKKLVGMIYRKDIDREYKKQNLIHDFELHATG